MTFLSRETSVRCAIVSFLLLIFTPCALFATEFQLQSETLFRFFERDTAAGNEDLVAPVYQYLELHTDSFAIDGLSFHSYGWARHDLPDSDFYNKQNSGELLYAYLDYRSDDSPFSVRLGRQYVFSGVTNDSIDGLWLKNAFSKNLYASVYVGQPVGLSSTNGRNGDSLFGGRLAHKIDSRYEIGLSYKSSSNDGDTAESLLGVDLAAELPRNGQFYGYSTRNLEAEGWAEHSYEINFQFESLRLRPFYGYYSYQNLFDTGDKTTNPFRVLSQSDEKLSTFGVDATWRQSEFFSYGGKLRSYSYDQNQSSRYFSLIVSWNSDSVELTQVGAEAGYMDGGAANNDYLLLRVYGFKDEIDDRYWLDSVSGEVTYALYDRDIFGQSSSLFVSFGAKKKFLDERMTVSLSGDYSQDPYFDSNLQALLSFSFAYDSSL